MPVIIRAAVLYGLAAGHSLAYLPAWFQDADVIRKPEFEHSVHCVDSNADLGRLILIDARSQPITDEPFQTANVSLHKARQLSAGGFLPAHHAALGGGVQVSISRYRRGVARHSARAWWDNDGRFLMVDSNLVVSAVGCEQCN